MDIDWSKAPEGATQWDSEAELFYCPDGFWVMEHFKPYSNKQPDEPGRFIPRPTRPAAPGWNGEGLPPVGLECDYVPDPVCAPHITVKGVFIGRVNDEDFVDLGDRVDRMKAIEPGRRFRPIRTQAERNREKAIKDAVNACPYPVSESTRIDVEALYDAGLLILPEGD